MPNDTKFAWSYSSLRAFETCPWRYYLTRVSKEVIEPETEVLKWGNEVHKVFEEYVKNNGEYDAPDWFERWRPIADKILSKPGDIRVEYEAAITEDLTPCGWWDNEVWCRGKFDVVIVDGATATILDYKTGNRKLDIDQLKLFALLGFIHFPQVDEIKTGYIWLKSGKLDTEVYQRGQAKELWPEFIHRVERMRHAFENAKWPKNQCGLCRSWCPVPNKLCTFSGRS